MYGKLFAQMYDGTLGTKGPWQALVTFQQLIILADKAGDVDMTAEAIARRTTIPLSVIQEGLTALEEPDPDSRTPDEEGRRIVRLSEDRPWGWHIVNHDKYRKIRSQEERREYMRQYQRERRERERVNKNVNTSTARERCQPMQEAVGSRQYSSKQKEEEAEAAAAVRDITPPPAHPDIGLLEHFPDTSHQDAYLAYRESHRHPTTFDASVRNVHAPIAGGPSYPWEVIGEALRDMAASQVVFTPRALTGFCRKVGAAAHGDREGQRAEIRARIDADIAAGKRGEMY